MVLPSIRRSPAIVKFLARSGFFRAVAVLSILAPDWVLAQPPEASQAPGVAILYCSVCTALRADDRVGPTLRKELGFEPVLEAEGGGGDWPGWFETSDAWARDQQNAPGDPKAPPEQNGKKNGKYSPSATTGSPGHIFWVIPAFKVTYNSKFTPLSPKEKFQEWAQSEYDPLGLGVGVFEAGTLEYSSTDGFCGYGFGWGGYGQCFGSLELDGTVSSFIGDYALTVLLHQDPRYFRLGKGSFGKRLLYTISRVFVTFNDRGKNVFYSSALTGTVAAAAISNLYYPQQDRGVSSTISRAGLDLGNTEIYNAAAEFWPDIHRRLHHKF